LVKYEVDFVNPEMPNSSRVHSTRPLPPNRLGERLRQLRVAAGLTQTDVAGTRFSKEYVSQIERGKTRPTRETVEWLAQRLGVDPDFLEKGVSTDQRDRIETLLARAEAVSEAGHDRQAIELIEDVKTAVLVTGSAEFEVRLLAVEAWTRTRLGEVREAVELLARARALAEGPEFSDVERADLLFRLGVARYKLSSIATSVALFDEALQLAERSGLPCDLLRSKILNWRSRCRRRQRDFEAAREDVERALELADGLDDKRMTAHVYFQASLIAEREGHWVAARGYAERARDLYEEVEDETDVGRLLNNLGGLNYLLGKPQDAMTYLKDAFKVLIDLGRDDEAASAVSSLAQIQLGRGELSTAEQQARHALALLGGREDRLDEIGNAQLVLGRSLLEQGRFDEADAEFAHAEVTFERFESTSHRAAVWIAKGDLAARRGNDSEAARLYRHAAEALQDFRF
jgi:transcriptional regulator with XRE-family HTH domain/Tfp pilus assembly protein PilF